MEQYAVARFDIGGNQTGGSAPYVIVERRVTPSAIRTIEGFPMQEGSIGMPTGPIGKKPRDVLSSYDAAL